ncbi:MAG: ribosomal protection-like ABC-F family protein [Christensenellales bacterium]
MAMIQADHLSFTYPGGFLPVFQDLCFCMDTSWRLGLVGRNGRGKTTLLRLLAGELRGQGQIISQASCDLFPFAVDEGAAALKALRGAIAPFDRWEREMAALLAENDAPALQRWGELERAYSQADGYTIDALIGREVGRMGIDPEALSRPFLSFSPGERTRMMLAALFLRHNRFLLIDEPTNHLDMRGRDIAGDYLASKQGFLLVSHDRAFLDRSVDHILALQKNSVIIVQDNYSGWRRSKQMQDDFERAQHERLSRDIRRMSESGREKAAWSDRVEASKIGTHAADRGYIGSKSAKMMKRSLAIRGRIDRQIEEKEGLLKELEYAAPLRLQPLAHASRVLLTALDLSYGYGGEDLISHLNLSLTQGERLALAGPNGSGKSTLLRLLAGEMAPRGGSLSRPGDLVISTLPQEAPALRGTPADWAQTRGLPLAFFLTLLRKFGFAREAFQQDMRGFSLGQQKKLLLATSMAQPAHLYLWDEPLNYIDVESREQIEEMLADTGATIVFVEHDRRFMERVATRILSLQRDARSVHV